jgi:hypothetical protein
MSMDENLRDALRREAAPAGFAERVIRTAGIRLDLTKNAAPTGAGTIPWWRTRRFALANAVALTAAMTIGGRVYQRNQEERALEARSLEARRQLITALSVTRTSLQKTRERIRRVTSHGEGRPVL